jgi:predicted phosphate transport protein (TIGR00153 family)
LTGGRFAASFRGRYPTRAQEARLRFRFLPKQAHFFHDFAAMAGRVQEGARLLRGMLSGSAPDYAKADEIRVIEHDCDQLTHQIIQQLHTTFVTPLDREDISLLAASLDDVMDWTEEVARRLRIYRMGSTTELARSLGRVLVEQCRALREAVPLLEDLRHGGAAIELASEKVHRLENEADDLQVEALGGLFDGASDVPTLVERIRWGDLYETLEEATDKAATVANVLQNIHIKHA